MSFRKFLRTLFNKLPLIGDVRQINAEVRKLRQDILALQTTTATVWRDFHLENHPRYGDPRRLLRYAAQVCSQNGEDGIIREIFHRIGLTNRVFAEVGVEDGSESNTAFLLSQGWSGYWIDGNPTFLQTIERRPDLAVGAIRGKAAFVNRENIAPVFQELGVPGEMDFLSLDIDQNTYYLWEGLAGFRPRVVVVEYNGTLPPEVDWKVNYAADRTWDGTNNFGASLKAFELLGRRLGYSLVGCEFIGANAFFVRDDLLADHFVGPFTSENHYEPPRYSLVNRRGHRTSILDRAGHA